HKYNITKKGPGFFRTNQITSLDNNLLGIYNTIQKYIETFLKFYGIPYDGMRFSTETKKAPVPELTILYI
ncbi:TPA: hypothetical protein ACG0AX_003785, partial [Elizabethkingia anophelis]